MEAVWTWLDSMEPEEFLLPMQLTGNGVLILLLPLLMMVLGVTRCGLRRTPKRAETVAPATDSPPRGPTADRRAEQLEETLPGILKDMLPAVLGDALREVLPTVLPATAGTTDGTGLSDALEQVLQKKLEAMQAKVDALLLDLTASLRSTLKDEQEKTRAETGKQSLASFDSVNKMLETLQQAAAQAEKNERVLETFLKGRLDVLETHTKSRIDLLNGDLKDKLEAIDATLVKHSTSHDRLDYLIEKLDGICDKLAGVGPKILQQNDRVEGCVRERTQSVQADLNKFWGECNQSNRDHSILVRTLNKSLEALQAAVASMGAAMGQPPVDSAGTQLLGTVQEVAQQLEEVAEQVKEINDKNAAPPPAQRGPPARDLPQPGVSHPSQMQDMAASSMVGSPLPPVIDLCSRIPAPVQRLGQTPLATVTLSNGRQILASEDEILGQNPPQFATFRR
eukprot:s29_g10.t1